MTGSFDRALPLAILLAATTVAAGSASCSSQSGGGTSPQSDAASDAPPADGSVLDAATPEGSDAGTEASADATSMDATMGGDSGEGGAGGDDAGEAGADGGCALGGFNEPLDLACTGLYSDFASRTVSTDVTQYDPGLHLWSDGAVKTRWIYLPPGADGGRMPIDTSNMDEWTFPLGTKFWKEFVLGGKRIETRLLWKTGPGNTWYRTTYLWSADETSAPELTDGKLNADGNGYQVPNQQDCDTCHAGRKDGVLGFEAVSLASAGATPVTVASLASLGWITDVPDASLAIPGNAVDVAALGYLHANCGIACHNAGTGEARFTGFRMRLDVATLATVQTTDTWTTGVNQATRAFQIPGESATLRLAPGDAGASCAFYRMSHRDGFDDVINQTQMPPLDSHKVDEAGVTTISTWIAQGCQ
jgi:hypothetical protein